MTNRAAGPNRPYAYDNDHPAAPNQLASLAALLDDVTIGRLTQLDLRGRRCLEIGAGGSALPAWLATEVGPAGHVVATDIQPRHVPTHPRLTPLAHNIITDPVPEPPYDLIHARLVLMHLPQREQILTRLADALAPGGVLCVEDWAIQPDTAVIDAPTTAARTLFAVYQHAVARDILTAAGTDPTWAIRIHPTMRAAGLRDLDTAIHAPVWHAGSPGLALVTVNIAQHRARLTTGALTDTDLDEIARLATDPGSGLVVRGHQLYSTIGRKD
ncbi:class I SAM-dependent methyltransferase [Polymorphospora rubra]|uniref:Methyltransferase n=1 Tax=Polymorphospora rubra TaxID=338584 RepID=A0A810MTZ1_9ACTN|nr:class I SAM-dependent methyltransferase [Polymorphospora rubra]BCJ64686.1 methyltransferase [Polymorphospora rubra]